MTSVTTVELRDAVSEIMNRAAFGKERFEVTRNGKALVAIVPIEDIRLLEELEERLDVILAREGVDAYESGAEEAIPLKQAKAEAWPRMSKMTYEVRVLRRAHDFIKGLAKLEQQRIYHEIDTLQANPRPRGTIKIHGSEAYRLKGGGLSHYLHDSRAAAPGGGSGCRKSPGYLPESTASRIDACPITCHWH